MGKLVAAVGGFGVLYLTLAACGGLFDQQAPPVGQQQSDHTTVIPVVTGGGDNTAAWMMIVLLVIAVVGVVVYAMNERSKRERAEDRVLFLASSQNQAMLNGRPVVNGYQPADFPEYRQIGR